MSSQTFDLYLWKKSKDMFLCDTVSEVLSYCICHQSREGKNSSKPVMRFSMLVRKVWQEKINMAKHTLKTLKIVFYWSVDSISKSIAMLLLCQMYGQCSPWINKFIRLAAPNNSAVTVITHLENTLNAASVPAATVSDIGIHGQFQGSVPRTWTKTSHCGRQERRQERVVDIHPKNDVCVTGYWLKAARRLYIWV